MDEFLPFGGREYFALLAMLAFARGMDMLSTRVATPNLVLEGNPIAKWLGWTGMNVVNLGLCLGFAVWPLPAIVISTASVLVAARNFQQAWLMRSMGEESYRTWHVARIRESRLSLYVWCLFGQTALNALVGAALVWFGAGALPPTAIGLGMLAYAGAVGFYTALSVWRIRRSFA